MLEALAAMGLQALPDPPHVIKRIWTYIVGIDEEFPMIIDGEEISGKPIGTAQYHSSEASKLDDSYLICFLY